MRPVQATHYELLGVAANATAGDIRTAYLRLMKQHHPDVTGTDGLSDVVRAINQAYRSLGDPARRGRYDASLGIAHTIVLRSPNSVVPPQPQRARWSGKLAALSMLAVAGSYLAYVRSAPAGALPHSASVAGTNIDRDDVLRRAAIVQQAGLNFEWIALQSDASAAEGYSQQCWDSLLGSGSDALFDYCLAFDAVAEHTFGPERVYFASAALANRARAVSSGRLSIRESVSQRIATIDSLLAREHRAGRAAPTVSWFPIPGAGTSALEPPALPAR